MTASSILKRNMTLQNKRGLHARASAKFVECAGGFDAKITVHHDDHSAGATSILSLMMLAAPLGTPLALEAEGPDAEAAFDDLEQLVNDKVDEE